MTTRNAHLADCLRKVFATSKAYCVRLGYTGYESRDFFSRASHFTYKYISPLKRLLYTYYLPENLY